MHAHSSYMGSAHNTIDNEEHKTPFTIYNNIWPYGDKLSEACPHNLRGVLLPMLNNGCNNLSTDCVAIGILSSVL